MGLKIYNTMTRMKEPFRLEKKRTIKMYVCGPTVYDYSHLGHAKSYVSFDVIRRYLEHKGCKVKFVENFTDVAEEISKKAMTLNISPYELSEKFTKEYLEDMDTLNVKRADLYPKVSEHISDIIERIKGLIEAGVAYEVGGEVFFDISKSLGCGILSGISAEELLSRVDHETKKHSLLDFALWKKPKVFEDEFDSPWGKGRPGWHIECYTMAAKHLGMPLDMQGGGLDLVFPHHENSHLMACALTSKDYAKRYMHNGFVTMGTAKMSKSTGHFISLRPLFKEFGGEAVRFYIIKTHYRANLDYDAADLESATKELHGICETLTNLKERAQGKGPKSNKNTGQKLKEDSKRFYRAMDDDFNTPKAVGTLLKLAEWSKTAKGSEKQLNSIAATIESFLQILGFSTNVP